MEFLKRTFIALCLLSTTSAVAHVYTPKYKQLLDMNDRTVCAQDDNGLRCYEPFGPSASPYPSKTEKIVDQLSMFRDTVTWLRDGKVATTAPFHSLNDYPKSNNPRMVSGNCILDDDGVNCWYPGSWKKAAFPAIPSMIFGGIYGVCGIVWGRFQCDPVKKLPDFLNYAVAVDFQAAYFSCAIIELAGKRTLRCWDHKERNVDLEIPNPRQLSISDQKICAIGDTGVQCWLLQTLDVISPIAVPPLKNPVAISAKGFKSACAIDQEGLACWQVGSNVIVRPNFKPAHPTIGNPQFNLDQIDEFLDVLKAASSPARAKLFAELGRVAKERLKGAGREFNLSSARYLIAKLIEPGMLSMNSKYSEATLLPGYRKSMEQIEPELLVPRQSFVKPEDTGIAHVLRSSLTIEVALRTIVAAITVAKEFAQDQQQSELVSLLRPLGQAVAAPNAANVAEVVAQLDARKQTFETLATNAKSAFLVDTINLAQEWLRR